MDIPYLQIHTFTEIPASYSSSAEYVINGWLEQIPFCPDWSASYSLTIDVNQSDGSSSSMTIVPRARS